MSYMTYKKIIRSLDILGAVLAIILFSPLFILISVLIKSGSKGPIFHKTERLGQNEKIYIKYKFRTMLPNSEEVLKNLLLNDSKIREEYRENYKIKNDPRVTKIGKLLRKISLDELPQLINILKGEMSLVGPRDIIQQELEDHYNHCKDKFLSVKPGLTGLWQISGRSRLPYEERVRLDLYYIDNQSLKLYFYILFKTVPVVLTGDGAI